MGGKWKARKNLFHFEIGPIVSVRERKIFMDLGEAFKPMDLFLFFIKFNFMQKIWLTGNRGKILGATWGTVQSLMTSAIIFFFIYPSATIKPFFFWSWFWQQQPPFLSGGDPKSSSGQVGPIKSVACFSARHPDLFRLEPAPCWTWKGSELLTLPPVLNAAVQEQETRRDGDVGRGLERRPANWEPSLHRKSTC